jgi:hypothetical protein
MIFNRSLIQSLIKKKFIRNNHFISFKGLHSELYINKNNISIIEKKVCKIEDKFIFIGNRENIIKLPICIENYNIYMNNGEVININNNVIDTNKINIKKD